MSGRPCAASSTACCGPAHRAGTPDDLEAQEMKTAIELRAARTGSDSPREEFVTDLHRRLAEQMAMPRDRQSLAVGPGGHPAAGRHRHRARGGLGGHRNRHRPQPARAGRGAAEATPPKQGVLEPNAGTWHAVGASADLPDGAHWRSTSALSAGSSTAPTPNWKRSPAFAPIRAASSGWTRRKAGCAARATRRRSRWRVRR